MLQNPEDRLKKILGSRQSHASTPHSQLEPDEDVPKSISAKNGIVNAEMELVVTDTEGRENKVITGEKEVEKGFGVDDQTNVTETPSICDLKDLERERDTEMERRQSLEKESKLLPDETSSTSLQGAALSPPRDIQTVENERSSLQSKRWRVVFNVVLAFVFVSKWTYVNLEVLLCTADKQALDDSHRILIHSESMIWPFLALQLFFVCVASFQKTSHSPFISMLTVALQLCGIPIQFTHKINFVLTALLAALKDFVVFLFSVIVIHHAVEYSISCGLLKQVLENFE